MITSIDNCILKLSNQFNGRFIVYQMSAKAYLDYVHAISRGGTRPRISREMLGNIGIIVPPLEEQQTIATFLDRETAKIDSLIAKVQEATERLKEYRTALISAAVTGKIDVRGV
jgi:restriction endonuclease S subunit